MGGPNSGRRPAPSSLGPAGVAGEGDVRYEREFDYLTRLDLLQPGELEAIQQKGA
jgi:hypothetical protein